VYKYFLKPIWIIFGVCGLGILSIAANVAQLTSFNIIDFLKIYAPKSYYFLLAGTLVLYIALVIVEFIRNKPTQQSPTQGSNAGQIISTGNVKNSTIIQIKKDKEG
jgi:hypothetical protein